MGTRICTSVINTPGNKNTAPALGATIPAASKSQYRLTNSRPTISARFSAFMISSQNDQAQRPLSGDRSPGINLRSRSAAATGSAFGTGAVTQPSLLISRFHATHFILTRQAKGANRTCRILREVAILSEK